MLSVTAELFNAHLSHDAHLWVVFVCAVSLYVLEFYSDGTLEDPPPRGS